MYTLLGGVCRAPHLWHSAPELRPPHRLHRTPTPFRFMASRTWNGSAPGGGKRRRTDRAPDISAVCIPVELTAR